MHMAKSPRKTRLTKAMATRLKASRIAAGFETSEEMAAELSLDAPTYRRYERGESVPQIDTLEDILRITGKSADWLLFGMRPRPPFGRPPNPTTD